tara:strand:- start:180 stop:716 length:537 start_codon:yes stop_codon:yes gene_type:complete
MESHGNGKLDIKGSVVIENTESLKILGKKTVLEEGVLLFHPENISIYDNVYIGHNTILKGYHKNEMVIGEGTWIGQQCFFHSAGGITIGKNIGIGPGVKILTSYHKDTNTTIPILHEEIEFKPVIIEDDSDLGVNSVIMPGVTIRRGTQVGAGAVVTKDFPEYSIIAGVPAKLIRIRK